MSRRDQEPVFVAEFSDRAGAEEAWSAITAAGIAAAVVTDSPPWGAPLHRVQVERRDAAAAVRAMKPV
ncbi:MAG: hypothetical protein HKN91_13180 [Acidimicrobiia bacterium]|nr:hypothetical protein [Acidimicrobiia bacterium]